MAGKKNFDPSRQGYNLPVRYLTFLGIVLVMFVVLITGIANLQLNAGYEYSQTAETRRTTKITLRGSRGMITDADAVILAKDEMIYNVTFYRDASQNSSTNYKEFTNAISEAIDIIEENGNELSVDFVIRRAEVTDPETGGVIEGETGTGSSISARAYPKPCSRPAKRSGATITTSPWKASPRRPTPSKS